MSKEQTPPLRTPDVVTPHRLTVAILIREFCKIRESGDLSTSINLAELSDKQKRRCIRDFCLLSLKLIQSPDISLSDLAELLISNEFVLYESLMRKFENTIYNISKIGVRFLLDIVDSIGRLVVPSERFVLVGKSSVIGIYLRRLVTSFDNMTFSHVTTFLDAFKQYSANLVSEIEESNTRYSDSCKPKIENCDEWNLDDGKWTRRQAELFIATQAALLTNNETQAMSPKELYVNITNILKSNPKLAEAHFLNYLNYLRVKEFCSAMDSLHQCFDRSVGNEGRGSSDEKNKGYRYALLNVVVLHYHFGNRDEAKIALQECIKIAQEAGDQICLQHALTWLYCLATEHKDKLIETYILKSLDLNLPYIMSLGIQSFIQQAGLTSGKPKHIFETLSKGDVLNCQNTHNDLISSSHSQKAALWQFYGKTEVSVLWSQLLLHITTENSTFPNFGNSYYHEGYCQAICNISNYLLFQGDYTLTNVLLHFAKENFPNEPISHIWMLCDNLYRFTLSLHREEYQEAEMAAQSMAVVDKDESCLRMAELYLQKQSYQKAQSYVTLILDKCKETEVFRMDLQVRAMILLADIQCSSCGPNLVLPGLVNLLHSALTCAQEFHLNYLLSMIHLRIAHVQLLMGLPSQALSIMDKCLVQILAHGGCYDRGRAILLHAKCLVANAGHLEENKRYEVILKAIYMLDKAKSNFEVVEAFFRVKDVLYLQARLFNEIDMIPDRNQCALQYRLINEEYPSKEGHTYLITVL